MRNGTRVFIYKNASGKVNPQEISSVSETSEHLQGYCLETGTLKTFRKDRVLEYLSDPAQAFSRLEYYRSINPKPTELPPRKPSNRKSNDSGMDEIHFTGFKKADKERLISLAKSNGMFVRAGVTNGLNYLCCGYNASKDKVEAARLKSGVVILSEQQLVSLLETGEIPDDE